MLVSQFTLRSIPLISPETSLAEVFPEDYPEGIQYAPVVKEGEFLGFLDLSDLEFDMETHQLVGDCALETVSFRLKENQHLFEAMPVFQKTGLSVLPVMDEKGEFDGVLFLESLAKVMSDSYAFQTDGGVLVLSIPAIHFSLSEISRLVEANQAKILSMLVESDPVVNQNYIVHLKINQPDLSRVVATLERFEFNVLEVHQSLEASSIDKDRFDQLMRYLGI